MSVEVWRHGGGGGERRPPRDVPSIGTCAAASRAGARAAPTAARRNPARAAIVSREVICSTVRAHKA